MKKFQILHLMLFFIELNSRNLLISQTFFQYLHLKLPVLLLTNKSNQFNHQPITHHRVSYKLPINCLIMVTRYSQPEIYTGDQSPPTVEVESINDVKTAVTGSLTLCWTLT